MHALEIIVALNEERHQQHLKSEGLTEQQWRDRSKELHGPKGSSEDVKMVG